MTEPSGGERRGATRVGDHAAPTSRRGHDGGGDGDFDRHVFFSTKAPTAAPTDGSAKGIVDVECARCHATTPMSLLQWTRAHAPLFLWVPMMRYSRYARCPACGQRSWVRLSLHS